MRARKGQALAIVAVMLPLFLSIVGLAVDGGLLFDAKREVQNVADGAARAGAAEIDIEAFRASGGREIKLDEERAGRIAYRYLVTEGIGGSVAVQGDRVVVRVTQAVPTTFMRIVGVRSVDMSAVASAEVQSGP